MRNLIFTPEADRDVVEAYQWYEGEQPGLGERFLANLEARLDSIRLNPEQYEPLFERFRRALVQRFPYAIFFESLDAEVIVYAVFHCSQHESKWRQRLRRS